MRPRRRLRLWGTLMGSALLLAACLPQAVVTQPDLQLRVLNEAGEPVAADVTLYWWEYPHRRQRGVNVVETDGEGTVAFTEIVVTETMMPLVPHGVPAYNWTFCIEAVGYKTLIGTVRNIEPGDAIAVNLTLHPGESFPVCANYDRLPYHHGTPVEAIDASGDTVYGDTVYGDVHGVYEVEEPTE